MIHALHLLWIIPLSAWFGFALAAVMAAAKRGDEEEENERRTP